MQLQCNRCNRYLLHTAACGRLQRLVGAAPALARPPHLPEGRGGDRQRLGRRELLDHPGRGARSWLLGDRKAYFERCFHGF